MVFFRVIVEPVTSKYEKRPYTCDKCQYKSSKLELLKKHIKTKCSVKDPTIYKCDQCSYSSIRKKHVKRHKMIHGGPRPYTCGVCEKGFTEKSNLRYHMLKHQPGKYVFTSINNV